MNERIHRYLDGEISLDDLSGAERREVEAYEPLLRRSAELHRTEPVPDLTSSVMARIPAEAEAPAQAEEGATGLAAALLGLARWMWSPRPVRLRPAYVVAGAAALLVAVLALPADSPLPDVAEDGAADRTEVFVQFRLDAPDASSVRLAGTFTDWEPRYRLHETSPGVWSLLIPLPPGVHDYSFVVDGQEWKPDPAAPRVDDGFGGYNSRVAVLSPTRNAI